jgi:hypothetical protein
MGWARVGRVGRGGGGIVLSALALLLLASSAGAHPERTTYFPDHTKGERPALRTTGEVHTVCRQDSRKRIQAIWSGSDPETVATREARLEQFQRCRFREIQAAVDAATSGDRIQILPGVYTEPTSRRVPLNDPKCPQGDPRYWEPTNDGHGENGMVPTYQFHWDCKNSRNLIQVLGDSPEDSDRECDQRCDLQIEGLGRTPEDVLLVGDRRKRDVLRADRADGIVITNLTAEQASFNGVDVVETNGFLLDHVVGRYNQNYGILTFTSDNGLYDYTEGYRNGDSGLYPGSGPEGHCLRYGIEIRNSSSHDNVLGQSGTAGNGTWIHHSKWFDNGVGIVNDSFASGHPGMPQDCSKWEDNEVFSNNTNFFERSNQEYCGRTPFEQRPREHVCPQFQSPVGSGFAFYGANHNIVRNNRVWDNWRSGYRLFWVPGAVRGDTAPEAQRDTSHGNRITENVFGLAPDGAALPNGVDVYWDEQGDGNCWQDNSGIGGGITSDPDPLPDCDSGGSSGLVSNPAKIGPETTCATWHPQTNPFPVGCTWFDTPPRPESS